MAMKNGSQSDERFLKKYILHEANIEEPREERKKRILKMFELVDSQEYKENIMSGWNFRSLIFKYYRYQLWEVTMRESKVGVCQIAHNCPGQGVKLPCLTCGPQLMSLDKLKLSIAVLKKLHPRKK